MTIATKKRQPVDAFIAMKNRDRRDARPAAEPER